MSLNVAGKGFAEGNLTVWLDTLAINSWTPGGRALSAAGMTTLTINGRGFDPSQCNNNLVWIGGVRCYVLGCTKSAITFIYPGDAVCKDQQQVAMCDGLPGLCLATSFVGMHCCSS